MSKFTFRNLVLATTSYFVLVATAREIANIYMLLTCILAFAILLHSARGLLSAFLQAIDMKDLDERIQL